MDAAEGNAMVLMGRIGRVVLLVALAVYLLLPILVVVLYAFATRWTSHIFPDGYTWQHWLSALTDLQAISALLRTLGLATVVTLLVNILVIPAVYWQWTQNPRIRVHLELIATIPFVLPFIVIALGILSLSGYIVPSWQGTVGLLILGHVAITFPFFYWSVDSAIAAANIPVLNEAAQTCGATPWIIWHRVILPNISSGIATGSLLVFATSFNEFALVQILVGNRFETISLYSLDLLTGMNADFNKLAVMTSLTFIILFIISVVAVYWNRDYSKINSLLIGKKPVR
jgi:putative spermidine/putrescine transport system permease protein